MCEVLRRMFPAHNRLAKISLNLITLLISIVWLMPLWMMTVYATQSEQAIFSGEIILRHSDRFFANFTALQARQDFARAIMNSIIVAGTATAFSMFIASMAGYALARFKFVGAKAIFGMIIFILAVPSIAIIIPEYVILVRFLGLSNTYVGAILPYLANAVGVFFMRQTFLGLPQEILEAAYLDGASEARIFFRIALPLVRPAMASLAIILFISAWNDYLWPLLVLTTEETQTAPIALGRMIGLHDVAWGPMMVGVSLMTVPFVGLFLLLQRQIVSGIVSGAVK